MVARIFPGLHQFAQIVAKDPAKIVVADIGQQAAGVCQHARVRPKQTLGGQGGQMTADPFLVVIEPPGGAMPDFPGDPGLGKALDQCVDDRVVGGIDGIQYRPGKRAGGIQPV